MGKVDPEKENARLEALYAGMSDDELGKVSSDPDALTHVARGALDGELKKRGLSWPAVETSPTEEGSPPVVLRRYRDMPQAMVDKTTLDSAGIECFLYDENLARMDWFVSNAIGGIKLVVAKNDAEEADKILIEAGRGNPDASQDEA
jgi:hypothetical protein